MSVFWDRKDELEKYEFMMGTARGRLAVSLDVLTDSLAMVGQHGINDAKELIASAMEELRQAREAERAQ